ncbi:MAG: hypothetical protein ACI9O4_001689 [Chitinophagales bacterium]
MRNIQVESDFESIKNRIALLSSNHSPRWGVMNLEDMLVHCTTQLKLALGEISAESQGPSIMRTRLGKWVSLSNIPWPRGIFTPASMNMANNKLVPVNIETEKKALLQYLGQVKVEEQLQPHPFFGNFTRQEWARMVYKHLDHHLKQFGV